ncbi:MAG: hypothetical protein PHG47_03120 [Sulfuricella sp.]|nr:hypothetical protein [Sulfuricella sp.]
MALVRRVAEGDLAGAEKAFPKIDLYSQQAIALPKQAEQDAAAR